MKSVFVLVPEIKVAYSPLIFSGISINIITRQVTRNFMSRDAREG
jgi:hypothetical protein